MHNPTSNIPAGRLPEYVADDERAIAALIVSELIAAGYVLSINNGEDWPVKRSGTASLVCAALAQTEADTLVARDAITDEPAGWVALVWGNGNALLSDWSSRATMTGGLFLARVETIADEITAKFA
jgi:hypothetical protein